MSQRTVTKPSDVLPRYQAMATWKAHKREQAGKASRESESAGRRQKRGRLGNAQDRAIYKHAHGWKHRDYPRIVRAANGLNGIR